MVLRYFDRSEFVMGNTNVFDKMDKEFLGKLDALRAIVGEPLFINSSYRSQEYNRAIGGSSGSKHMEGIAVDFKCTSSRLRAKIVRGALNLGLTVGPAKTFVHVDNRESQILYLY